MPRFIAGTIPPGQSLGQSSIIENVSGADGTRLTQTDIR
jgi:hypothetical protein